MRDLSGRKPMGRMHPADGEAAAAKKETLRERGFRFFELPAWENLKGNVVYAEKK